MSSLHTTQSKNRPTASITPRHRKIVLFANTDWYLYNFRRSLALALGEAGHDVLLISPEGPYGEKLRALGLRWEAVAMDRRSLNPLRETALLWHLSRLLRRERPHLVHGFTIKGAVYAALAARLAGVQARVSAVDGMGYVFTSSDIKAKVLRPFVQVLLKLSLSGKGSRLILQNSNDLMQFEQARLTRKSAIRLIPGAGVDCAKFKPGSRKVLGAPFQVLLPARLLWEKGIAEYIDAARLLRNDGRAIRFMLAGAPDAGNPAAVPEQAVREWVAEGVVEWLGHVDDMAALLSRIDVVVLPSFYREGLPTGLIEAGACGLPSVTTDAPGCRDAVQHDLNGLLVPVRNARALADAIARLQDDPALAARLGASARRRVVEEFDEKIVIARTFDVYRELGVECI